MRIWSSLQLICFHHLESDINLKYVNFNIHFNEGYSHVAFLPDEHIYYF